MSMQPQSIPPVPPDTEAVARAAFPKGNIYVLLRDNLGSIYSDEVFTALFSKRGQPAQSPWRLALISIMQFVENLSDRQAADAVRSRIDWKYALSLPLTDPGFDFSILSEFRQRLISAGAEQLLLDKLLERLGDLGLLKRERQRTDSTHIIAAVRHLNRLETLGETLRAALNSLATVAPDWLMNHLHCDWFDRYSRRIENYRLPKLDSEREALGNLIGKDGFTLLNAIYSMKAPFWLRQIQAVEILRQVWVQQFYAPSEEGVATCPMGQQSITWSPRIDISGQPIIDIRFPTAACRACRVRRRCTRSKKDPRGLTIRAQAFQEALQTRRQSQQTPEFLKIYHQRAGIEATLSQGTRRTCLRRSRYTGLAKTHLQHILIATAINLVRLDAWLNDVPIAKTRVSRFKQLQPKPA